MQIQHSLEIPLFQVLLNQGPKECRQVPICDFNLAMSLEMAGGSTKQLGSQQMPKAPLEVR